MEGESSLLEPFVRNITNENQDSGFCPDKFWDTDLLLSSSWPRFTECFQYTVLVFVPFACFWIPLPLYMYKLASKGGHPLPMSCLSIIKMFLATSLSLLSIVLIIEDASNDTGDVPVSSAQYLSNSIRAISYATVVFLIYFERRYHTTTSGVLFVLWMLLVICDVVPLLSKIMLEENETSFVKFVLFVLIYAMEVLQVLLNCVCDSAGEQSFQERTSPEVKASFPSQIFYWWVTRTVYRGWKKDLEESDLFDLNPRDSSDALVPAFEREWVQEMVRFRKKRGLQERDHSDLHKMSDLSGREEKEPLLANMNGKVQDGKQYSAVRHGAKFKKDKRPKPSLLRVLSHMVGPKLLIGLVQKIVSDVFLLLSPVLLSLLIDFAENQDTDFAWKGYGLAVLLFVSQMFKSVLFNFSFWMSQIVGMQLKSALISAIYKKALTMDNESKKESTAGEIVNLMSVDCQRVQDVMNFFFFAWTTPLQVIIAIAVLYQYIGPSAFAGLAVLLLTVPFNSYIAAKQQELQVKNLKHKDARLRLTNESLSGMKVLKLYSWEPPFQTKISDLRDMETKVLLSIAYLNVLISVCFNAAPYLVMLATFAVYVNVSDENHLDAKKAFVALSFFNLLKVPLSLLSTIISMSVQAIVSIERINTFLCTGDLNPDNVKKDSRATYAIEVDKGTFTWDKSTPPTLRNINLKVPIGKVYAVVGPVGCGKSSLMSALLGEMEKLSGKACIKSTVAYVPQQVWIQNATVKDNILFGKPFDRKKYKRVISACALERDLEILSAGDQTEIGEKGINLSGGQKQRVSLARAVYSNADIYIFDDPLSAVDTHVGKHIFSHVIGHGGVLNKKTRVLVTHGAHWLPMVDSVVVMDDGMIREAGTYEDLMSHNGAFAEFIKTYMIQPQNEDEEEEDEEIRAMKSRIMTDVESATSDGATSGDEGFGMMSRGRRKPRKAHRKCGQLSFKSEGSDRKLFMSKKCSPSFSNVNKIESKNKHYKGKAGSSQIIDEVGPEFMSQPRDSSETKEENGQFLMTESSENSAQSDITQLSDSYNVLDLASKSRRLSSNEPEIPLSKAKSVLKSKGKRKHKKDKLGKAKKKKQKHDKKSYSPESGTDPRAFDFTLSSQRAGVHHCISSDDSYVLESAQINANSSALTIIVQVHEPVSPVVSNLGTSALANLDSGQTQGCPTLEARESNSSISHTTIEERQTEVCPTDFQSTTSQVSSDVISHSDVISQSISNHMTSAVTSQSVDSPATSDIISLSVDNHETSASISQSVNSHETSASISQSVNSHETSAAISQSVNSHETSAVISQSVNSHKTSAVISQSIDSHETSAVISQPLTTVASSAVIPQTISEHETSNVISQCSPATSSVLSLSSHATSGAISQSRTNQPTPDVISYSRNSSNLGAMDEMQYGMASLSSSDKELKKIKSRQENEVKNPQVLETSDMETDTPADSGGNLESTEYATLVSPVTATGSAPAEISDVFQSAIENSQPESVTETIYLSVSDSTEASVSSSYDTAMSLAASSSSRLVDEDVSASQSLHSDQALISSDLQLNTSSSSTVAEILPCTQSAVHPLVASTSSPVQAEKREVEPVPTSNSQENACPIQRQSELSEVSSSATVELSEQSPVRSTAPDFDSQSSPAIVPSEVKEPVSTARSQGESCLPNPLSAVTAVTSSHTMDLSSQPSSSSSATDVDSQLSSTQSFPATVSLEVKVSSPHQSSETFILPQSLSIPLTPLTENEEPRKPLRFILSADVLLSSLPMLSLSSSSISPASTKSSSSKATPSPKSAASSKSPETPTAGNNHRSSTDLPEVSFSSTPVKHHLDSPKISPVSILKSTPESTKTDSPDGNSVTDISPNATGTIALKTMKRNGIKWTDNKSTVESSFASEYVAKNNVHTTKNPADGSGYSKKSSRNQSALSPESPSRSPSASFETVRSAQRESPNTSTSRTVSMTYESSMTASMLLHSQTVIFDESNSGDKGLGKLVQSEKLERGKVKLSVFLSYAKATGKLAIFISFLMFALFQVANAWSNFWLTDWTDDPYLANTSFIHTNKYKEKNDYYLGIFGLFGILQVGFLIVHNILYWVRMVVAAKRLHFAMLKSLFRSPMSFFDTTPLGRIMNRFSRDIEVVDNNLPIIIRDYTQTLFTCVVTLIIISISTPLFLSLVVPIMILYYFIQNFYIPTSRQLKRIESVTRSPIYTHFSETISGGPTIRAYDVTTRFIKESKTRVDRNQSFYYISLAANRWLGMNLELLANTIILGSAIFAVLTPGISGGDVGLSVSYAIQVSSNLVWMVRQMSDLETNIVSVERLKEYSELESEAEWVVPQRRPVPGWPSEGNVTFSDYMTRYRPGLDLVLKGITCDFKSGEKIGIVGRTGAGKSSLALALFRLVESSSGYITVDGVKISDIGLHDVRSRLTILPQDPVLFFGTLRMNLDPVGEYEDHLLWKALTSAHLRDFVHNLPEGLDYEVGEEGQSLSVGQRQLVCLARALLKKTKILILDEATAAVDMETDTLIQKTIRTEFDSCTIITIAHRLNTIMDYDRIMVLDAGLIKELDSPSNLLADSNTIFYSMAKEANLI